MKIFYLVIILSTLTSNSNADIPHALGKTYISSGAAGTGYISCYQAAKKKNNLKTDDSLDAYHLKLYCSCLVDSFRTGNLKVDMSKVNECSKYGENEKAKYHKIITENKETYKYAFNMSFPKLLSSMQLNYLTIQCLHNNKELKSKYGIDTIKYCSCFVDNIEDELITDPKKLGTKLSDSFIKRVTGSCLKWSKDK